MYAPVPIKSLPGIKRDGTEFEGDNYVDGEWVRFQRGLPRKIGGYRSINKFAIGLARTLSEYSQDGLTYIHTGSSSRVERFFIDTSYNTSLIVDRTPSTGFTVNPDNLWQFSTSYDTTLGNQLVAQVAPNLDCICNSTGGDIYTGNLLGTAPLVRVPTGNRPANFSVTGGVVSLAPYTFAFGNDGYVAWSVPNKPNDFVGAGAGNAYVTSQKIVKGMPLRGGPGSSPSGLLWSADSLIRASYVGGTAVFQFDTISTQSSILSAASVIEYDGVFYWAGVDRFLMFNGVVREVENNLNLNFFFDNLNVEQRQKVFAYKVPRFGEIWWCFPKGDSLEPNHAVIYNTRENIWYDTPLPNGGRGAGIFPSVFQKPILTGVAPQQAIATAATIASGGTGYAVGNVLLASGGSGSIPVEVTVATIGGGGAVTGVTITNAGRYSTVPANPVTFTGGAGSGLTLNLTFVNPYQTWVHEVGVDEVDGGIARPILSFFETNDISLATIQQTNNGLSVAMIEPDFVQKGDMTVQLVGRQNARSPRVEGPIMTFPGVATTPNEEVVFIKDQRRQLRLRFSSNVVGGDYQMGIILAHMQPGDGRTLG